MDGCMEMLNRGWQEIIYISMDWENISIYIQFVCLKSLKTAAAQSYQGETVGFCKTQPTRPLWGNSTAVKLLRICFQTTCIQGTAQRFEVCLGFIFGLLLTSFLAVVSTELEITPLASRALNAKLCLVNEAVCLDSFCRLGSLNFNASSEGMRESASEGQREEAGSCLQTALQSIIYVQLNWQKCLPHTLLPTVLTFASCTVWWRKSLINDSVGLRTHEAFVSVHNSKLVMT